MFLGHHTIEDVKQLVDVIDFRVKRIDDGFHEVMDVMKMTGPDAEKIKRDWIAIKKKWTDDSGSIRKDLMIRNLEFATVPASMVAAEAEYQRALLFVQDVAREDNIPGLQRRIEPNLGRSIDIDTGRPKMDTDPDFDQRVLQIIDATPGLKQASAAGKKIAEVLNIDNDQKVDCGPTGRLALKAGGMTDAQIDALCKKDNTIRNVAIAGGAVLGTVALVQIVKLLK